MTKTVAPLLLSLFFIACSSGPSPEQQFDKKGVSFTSPARWKISEEEEYEESKESYSGYYLSVEKEGFDESGIVLISWIDVEIDLDDWQAICTEKIASNIIYRNTNLQFGPTRADELNGIPTQSVQATFSLLGLEHEVNLHFFHANGKTFDVMIQQATEDNEKNKEGFDTILKSFQVE
jgi:hypothetical protein